MFREALSHYLADAVGSMAIPVQAHSADHLAVGLRVMKETFSLFSDHRGIRAHNLLGFRLPSSQLSLHLREDADRLPYGWPLLPKPPRIRQNQ